jgi:hypothetical protein
LKTRTRARCCTRFSADTLGPRIGKPNRADRSYLLFGPPLTATVAARTSFASPLEPSEATPQITATGRAPQWSIGILAGILDDRSSIGHWLSNPARRFKRGEKPKKSQKRHAYLTEADVCRLAEESGSHADLVLILGFVGIRRGEAIALTVADIEFLKRRISVHCNAVQVGQDIEVGQTKGKENRSDPNPHRHQHNRPPTHRQPHHRPRAATTGPTNKTPAKSRGNL